MRTRLAYLAIIVLAGFGLISLFIGLAVHRTNAPTIPRPVAGSIAVSPAPQPSSPALRALPERIIIPAIKVDAPIRAVGESHGVLDMPPLSNHNLAAWWKGSVAPGQIGPAVIAGHVDSFAGPSVFWRLWQLKPGDTITIERHGAPAVVFTITRLTEVRKTALPMASIYGPTTYPAIRLATCGGQFDYATGHYEDNIIVYGTETS